MKKQNQFTQQLKKSVRDDFAAIRESEDLLRDSQRLLRKVQTIGAPRLDPQWLLRRLYHAVRYRDAAILGMAFSDVATWAGFWIKMFFRWLYDELAVIFINVVIRTLMVLGYVVGVALVVALIFFILTY
jgi:hypothetical protein